MKALWSAREAAQATGGKTTGTWSAHGLSIDTRTLSPGDLFVALKGPRFDAHDFIVRALDANASAAVAEHTPAGADPDRLLLVKDTRKALEDLARAARARTDARVAAVTGSVGKTGTKEMLARALASRGPVHATEGNLNNHIGLPLTLARMPPEARFGVFEMGMNHAGEIAPLSRLARPHVAVITTVEGVHMEHFDSLEAIADAKAEVFAGLEPGGVAVLNRDNPLYDRLEAAARDAGVTTIVGFGTHPEARARLLDCAVESSRTIVFALIDETPLTYVVGASGRHWAINSLAALAAATVLGAELPEAAATLAAQRPPKGRGERHLLTLPDGGVFELIDESYNASPASMRAVIGTLAGARPRNGGRRVAILGDMLELGPDGPDLHADLAVPLIQAGIDAVFTAGGLMERLHEALPRHMRAAHAPDSAALAPKVSVYLRHGDVVMVKGSAGSRMGLVVEALKALGEEGASNAV